MTHVRRFSVLMVLLAAFQSTASAENGQPSAAALKAMALSDLQIKSDAQAMKVRGQGAFAGGLSYAYIGTPVPFPPAASINVYGTTGPYFAAGGNNSHADALVVDATVVVGLPGGGLGIQAHVLYTRVSAGGSSWAKSF